MMGLWGRDNCSELRADAVSTSLGGELMADRSRLKLRIGAFGGLLLISGFGLEGCASGGLVVPNSAFHVLPCPAHSDPYPVTDLAKDAKAHCDFTGRYVQFPNGYKAEVPSIGTNSSVFGEDGATNDIGVKDTYLVFNFGKFGVVAGQRSYATGRSSWWGSGSSLEAYEAAHGTKVPKAN
jgi:hypothetical protein